MLRTVQKLGPGPPGGHSSNCKKSMCFNKKTNVSLECRTWEGSSEHHELNMRQTEHRTSGEVQRLKSKEKHES